MDSLNIPHGGELVNLIVDAERARSLKALSRDLPSITLSGTQEADLEMLMNGAFSPLRGFLGREDYESVLERMRLADGTLWPMPVCLAVSEEDARQISTGQFVALRNVEGFMLAVLHVRDMWPIDKTREASAIFGSEDPGHPGVERLCHGPGSYYVGGPVEGMQLPLHAAFKRLRHSPSELRATFRKLGWRRIVGFQTRHPLHRPQYELTMRAMAMAKANLLLHPVALRAKHTDIDYYTRVHCYLAALQHYPPSMAMLSLLPLAMRLAGPREAVWHALIRKNFGCTHFVVGRGHASPGLKSDGTPFYQPGEAIELTRSLEKEIGIEILAFPQIVYAVDEDEYVTVDEVASGVETRSLSYDDFHRRLRAGHRVPEWFTFPEVLNVMRQAYPPRHTQGFTVFCTGLSGAGKSTIAQVLYARFLEMGGRPVTLLDGDIVRLNLSSELGFSRQHRDLNVRRIGFVAGEITKNGGIAICAPIAPYRQTRREIRRMIEGYGGFVEVYVGTPLDVCEGRDRKGLYAKARAGQIKGFTGIDDPYEAPETPEVFIDTTEMTPDEAAQEILLFLERAGYIR